MSELFEKILEETPLLRHLLTNAQVHGILVLDDQGYVLYCNKSFERNYGYHLEEIKGKSGRFLFTEADQKKLLPEREIEVTKSEGCFRDRNYVVHKDGRCIFVDGESVLTRDALGNVFILKLLINIHEQKVMERLVAQARQFSDDVLGSIGAAIMVVDEQLNILKVNNSFCRLFGMLESTDGKSLTSINHTFLSSAPFTQFLFEALGATQRHQKELSYTAETGMPMILKMDVKHLELDRARLLVVLEDVTAERAASELLRQSEQRMRNLIDEALVATAVYLGEDMRIAFANQPMLDIMGKGPSVIGKTFIEALPEMNDQPYPAILKGVYTTGRAYQAEEDSANLFRDGVMHTSYYNHSCKPLRDETGTVYGILNMAVDVSEMVAARKAVQANERSLYRLIMHAPVGICIVEKEQHRVRIVNDHYLALIGKERQAIEGKNHWKALPQVQEAYAPVFDEVFATGVAYHAREQEVTLLRDGRPERLFVSFVLEPLHDEWGNTTSIIIVAVDVTQQVAARQQVEQLVAERTAEIQEVNRKLQNTNDELSQFVFIASHDLQEPLRKIKTFCHYLKDVEQQGLGNKGQDAVDRIISAAQRMTLLIKDVLDYATLGGGQATQDWTPVDLSKVVASVLKDLEHQIAEKEAEVIVGTLPVVCGSEPQMQQLFSNLLTNALKFSNRNQKPRVSISAESMQEGETQVLSLSDTLSYCKIIVQDNGIGFSNEFRDKMFVMFQRLHSKEEFTGTGIGLAIVKKIVDNHKGKIEAHGQAGVGARFTIYLPCPADCEQIGVTDA